ncbi:hypothetical protein GY21_10455 [Cryobacterium roopkundense]|uniref:Major facilitator superfamily (MFS) profile domain-containing protein n=1 Tax=Cryobacterium roopkundense TaxID=1001240 RepID=A0A099JAD7_9MICO|nr:hypothetical protein [Cryobacterium roopkundense]KGJ74458.1 hypothetical protein GY21_10455 [Cryobacterium roopkundense]MBB5643428.1 hypothetical protein [Cryobacterium roopkundense]
MGNLVRPYTILFLVVAFVCAVQTFLNIAIGVYLSEVFPLHLRGFGIGVSIIALWVTNRVLSL